MCVLFRVLISGYLPHAPPVVTNHALALAHLGVRWGQLLFRGTLEQARVRQRARLLIRKQAGRPEGRRSLIATKWTELTTSPHLRLNLVALTQQPNHRFEAHAAR